MKPQGKKNPLFSPFVLLSIVYSVILVANVKPACGAVSDNNFYYYSSGREITLPLSKEMVAVRFKPEVTLGEQKTIVESQGTLPSFSERKELPVFKITLLSLRQVATEETIIQTIDSLNANEDVEFANPVFDFPDAELTLTDEFIVKFSPSVTEKEIESFNALNNVEIARKEKWADWYVLRVKDPKNMNTLNMSNLYYKSPLTEFSVPNFVRRLEPMSVTPNDTYFQQQWALHNVGQIPPGGTQDADIDAPEGWEISPGSPDIVIAIIDEGVDLTHEDLANKLVAGYDYVEGDNDPTPWGDDAHGTACAGLAAAQTNNATGVAGVAWDCKIMPIRIAYGYGGGWWTYDEWLAGGIQWAADNGADVLSNSWGGGSPSDAITEAVQYAKNYGRGGKGCVVVFAAGNSGSYVAYPAWLDEVIAVGATDHHDEKWDYSNYGPELDVVAPSAWGSDAGVILWTTDISGSAGYNDGDLSKGDAAGNYTKWFGGTSAATPQVAGLAALILSVNPNLTSDEVQTIIESTTDDKGDPGWDQFYGWGRINVYKAFIEAAKNEQILSKVDNVDDGDSVLPDDEITYTISYANAVTDPNDANYIGPLTDVQIIDYLPIEVAPDNPFDPNYDPASHSYTWDIGTLSPGDSNSVTLTVIVNGLAEPLGTISNICFLDANEIGPVIAVEVTDVNSWNPGVIYVDVNAAGANTGMSWENAYRGLQDGLARAAADCGSEIWVAAGTYKPTTEPNNLATFKLVDDVGIYGGFAGNETYRNQRNSMANETILSGDIDDDGDSDVQDVVTALNVGETTIIDGFTITKGDWSGIWCDVNSSPTIANNTIKENNYDGIDCNENSGSTIIDCTIEDNGKYGIWCLPNSSPTITRSRIQNSGDDGIYCQAGSDVNLIACIIAGNDGDGIYCNHSTAGITNCMIQDNGDHGIYDYNSTDASVIADNIIRGNIENGIYCHEFSCGSEIKNNWIYENGASGIETCNPNAPLTNAVIVNNTIVNNDANGVKSDYAADVNITNCIIWDNGDDPNDNLYADDNATFDVSYSCVEYDTNYTGTGNINGDPCFVDDVNDDYHLTWNSPCVDWGDPNFVEDANETDIDGNPRIMGGRVDMGGDEDFPHCDPNYTDWVTLKRPNCWMWDYQCDGDADGINSGAPYYYRVYTGDMALIIANWKKKAGDQTLNACADIDHISSGEPYYYRVYTGDIAKVIANWRKKPGTPPTGLAGDCVERGCQRGALGGGSPGSELSSKELLNRLAEIWLDPEVQKTIDEEKFLKVYESLKELSNQ